MLSEEALEKLSERLVNRIEQLNEYFVNKLGKQIVDIGTVTPSQVKELLQSVKYGNDIDEIMYKISEITDMNVKDIYKIFEEVAKKNQAYAKQFYEYRDIKYIPFDENIALKKHVKSIADATVEQYLNISNTMAYTMVYDKGIKEFSPLSEMYQKVTDEAILSISQGREVFDTTMKRVMKELTSNGLRTVDYASGYSRRLDSSVRMNIMDGVRRLNRELQEEFGKEFDSDGIEVSHHIYPAPDHEDTIDGKQFSNNGEVTIKGIKYDDYDTVNNSLDRHVGELNCYHFIYPIVLGVSKPLYSKEQLEADKKRNKEGFDFDGKHYTMYEGTQLQRQLETKIRQYKDRQIGAKAINDTDEVYHCQEKISQLTQKYNDLHNASGLPTKIDRLRVEGYKKVSTKSSNIDNNYVDVTQEWLDNATPKSHKVLDRQYFIDEKGNRYDVDGKNVVLDYSVKEKEMAEWLESKFGGQIYMLPRINNPEGIKTPDYLWKNDNWDLKGILGKSNQAFYHAIYKKENQSKNFIFDISHTSISMLEAKSQIYKLYKRTDVPFIEKIIVKKDSDFLVYIRKRM